MNNIKPCTLTEYNKEFYPRFCNALSFVNCLNHALQKCDEPTLKQMQCIGYSENTITFLEMALEEYKETVKEKCVHSGGEK